MKLELYYPLKPIIQTQKFGEKAFLAYYHANGVNVPGHNGIDYAAPHGTPIYAAHDGIAYYEVDQHQGHGVIIITDKQFDYQDGQSYFKTIYWHMVDPVQEPEYASPVRNATLANPIKVRAGDVIGYVNTTGLSTGDHLHFGLKPVGKNEPANIWFNLEQKNGYFGSIDPFPYFNGKFAADIGNFNTDMEFGERGSEVRRLQDRLKELGYFPATQESTGYYGEVTRKAVFDFQKKYLVLSPVQMYIYRGRYCSTKTREALNGLVRKES